MYDELLKKAERKLSSAEYLLEGGYYDDAISRAYYSMFYAARALLSLKHIYPKTHKGVILQFGLEFIERGFVEEMYGKAISYAKDRREEADYGVDIEIMDGEARDIIEDAKEFLEKTKKAIDNLQTTIESA